MPIFLCSLLSTGSTTAKDKQHLRDILIFQFSRIDYNEKDIFMGLNLGPIVVTTLMIITSQNIESVFAQDASELGPGEDPHIPGWDPNGANEDALDQQHCIGCTNETSPGQEGLEAGTIGPHLKK